MLREPLQHFDVVGDDAESRGVEPQKNPLREASEGVDEGLHDVRGHRVGLVPRVAEGEDDRPRLARARYLRGRKGGRGVRPCHVIRWTGVRCESSSGMVYRLLRLSTGY